MELGRDENLPEAESSGSMGPFPSFSVEGDNRIDRFAIIRPIGAGGIGEVFLARHPSTGREVAVKKLKAEFISNERAVRRFLIEARHMYDLNHPRILRIMEVWDPPEGPYYVMPYMRRGALSGLLTPGQPLELSSALRIAEDIAEAVCFAHGKGILHRDLKPANVLIDEEGHAYLSDFGLLREFSDNASIEDLRQSQRVGTGA